MITSALTVYEDTYAEYGCAPLVNGEIAGGSGLTWEDYIKRVGPMRPEACKVIMKIYGVQSIGAMGDTFPVQLVSASKASLGGLTLRKLRRLEAADSREQGGQPSVKEAAMSEVRLIGASSSWRSLPLDIRLLGDSGVGFSPLAQPEVAQMLRTDLAHRVRSPATLVTLSRMIAAKLPEESWPQVMSRADELDTESGLDLGAARAYVRGLGDSICPRVLALCHIKAEVKWQSGVSRFNRQLVSEALSGH